jgi:hypothetical protein
MNVFFSPADETLEFGAYKTLLIFLKTFSLFCVLGKESRKNRRVQYYTI